jgi:hypothetical protein
MSFFAPPRETAGLIYVRGLQKGTVRVAENKHRCEQRLGVCWGVMTLRNEGVCILGFDDTCRDDNEVRDEDQSGATPVASTAFAGAGRRCCDRGRQHPLDIGAVLRAEMEA